MHTETLAPAGTEVRANKISLNTLAEMTGFPAELIQQELFSSQETAENEGVDKSCICSKFPEKEKTEQNQNTGNSYDAFVFSMAFQIKLLTFRNFIHCGLTPSISD